MIEIRREIQISDWKRYLCNIVLGAGFHDGNYYNVDTVVAAYQVGMRIVDGRDGTILGYCSKVGAEGMIEFTMHQSMPI